MREISPALNLSADEYLRTLPGPFRRQIAAIRMAKLEGTRPLPSASLVDTSVQLDAASRARLLDKTAALVDENLSGRADMCVQFAQLLDLALRHLGVRSRVALGKAKYFVDGQEVFSWPHAWVRIGDEVVDGNIDSVAENPMVPAIVVVPPYWGPINQTPPDRRFEENRSLVSAPDDDVERVWWPDMKDWLDRELRRG
jgi:hypothetical protein